MAAVFEEQHLGGRVVSVIKTNGPITADVILQHAAARAAAVHLVNAEMVPDVQFAPHLDEKSASGFLSEQRLQRGAFVLDVADRLGRFDFVIIQSATGSHSGAMAVRSTLR